MGERNEEAYSLVLKINEIAPDQWDEFDERDYTLIDAALRHAKAEGVRLVQKEMEESGNQRLGGWINWCDARAAQIEEGE